MKSSIVILFFLFSALELSAQNLKKDCEAMYGYLGTLQNYRMTVGYSTNDTTEFQEAGSASVFVCHEGLFYNLQSALIMINSATTIVVDSDENTIIYADNEEVKKKDLLDVTEILLNGIDTLSANSDTITYYALNDKRTYTIRYANAYFNLIEVVFGEKMIERIVYHYNSDFIGEQGLQVECEVSLEENIDFDKKLLQKDFYLFTENGQTRPSENFTNYLIVYNESVSNYFD